MGHVMAQCFYLSCVEMKNMVIIIPIIMKWEYGYYQIVFFLGKRFFLKALVLWLHIPPLTLTF